ncbi:hypothetical protein MNBD_ACTINO01-1846 [hydrothermal vent metagenome]|uniref:Uncharacterized protein n=1 Tax=hydrothermal vent metagenome TaxID=652676 RepID=A0A3B0SL69_9ZZZZ
MFVFALVVAACTPAGDTTGDADTVPGQTSDAPDGSGQTGGPGSGDEAGAPEDADLPPIPILYVSEPVVGTGDTVAITTDARRTGTVVMGLGEEIIASAPMTGGTATLVVPASATPGDYPLELRDDPEGAAYGIIRIADGPTLWVTASTWTSTGDTQKATIDTYGIPDGMTVALELTSEGQAPERLVPQPLTGLAPIPFGTDPGEGVPRGRTTWALPEDFTGTVRAVADRPEALSVYADTEEDPSITSTAVRVKRCDEPTGITGDLGGPGSVRALWSSDSIEAATAVVDEGPFALIAQPGMVMVAASRGMEATESSPQFLNLRCGEILDIGSMDEPIDTGPAPGTYLGGKTLDDMFAFTAVATGDIEFEHEGTVDCSATGREIELSFEGPGSDLHFYYLTIPDFSGTGRYDAEFQIINVLEDGDSTGPATVEIEQGRVGDLDAVGGIFSATYEGALGSGTIEGTFACVFLTALQTVEPPLRGVALPGNLLAAPLLAVNGTDGAETCRTAFSLGGGDYESIDLVVDWYSMLTFNRRLPRVAPMTASDARAILDHVAMQMLLGTRDDAQDAELDATIRAVGEAVASDYLVVFRVDEIGGGWHLSVTGFDMASTKAFFRGQYTASTEEGLLGLPVDQEMAAALLEIGICGEVDQETVQVTSGEEKEITYKLTDLAGKAAEGAIDAVSSTCGTFEPESGNTENGEFTTTFTGGDGGCTDQVTFVARTETAVGEVTTEQDADESTTAIAIPTFGYRYTIDYDSTTAVEGTGIASYSSGSASIHAESEGEFIIDTDLESVLGESPLIGFGRGTVSGGDPAAPCILISSSGSDVVLQEWSMEGAYNVLVSGKLATGSPEDGGTLYLSPGGYRLNLTGSWSNPECFPPGSQSNEIFSYVSASLFVINPSILVNAFPDGFEIPFTADGQTTKKSWPITLGEGDGTVTIEVWQEIEGGA